MSAVVAERYQALAHFSTKLEASYGYIPQYGKIGPVDSLKRNIVIPGVTSNGFGGINEGGQIFRVEPKVRRIPGEKPRHVLVIENGTDVEIAEARTTPFGREIATFDTENTAVQTIAHIIYAPISRISDFDLVNMHAARSKPAAFIDVPYGELEQNLRIEGKILEGFAQKIPDRGVFVGGNCSLAVLLYGAYQSVKWPHEHLGVIPEGIDIEPILKNRREMPWDYGLSASAGRMVAEETEKSIHEYRPDARIGWDNLGVIVEFPEDFSPGDIGDLRFAKFLETMHLTIHDALDQYHQAVYASTLTDVAEYVRSCEPVGNVDWDTYNKFFTRRDPKVTGNYILNRLNQLADADELRKGFGWGWVMYFTRTENKKWRALFATMMGIEDIKVGGLMEALGFQMDRGREMVHQSCVIRKGQIYRRIVDNALVA